MPDLNEIKTFCQLLYADSNIPIYLYENQTLLTALPRQPYFLLPPERYVNQLAVSAGLVSHLYTEYNIVFAGVKSREHPEFLLVLGPVNHIPFTDADFYHMYADYVVVRESRGDFREFFQRIPPVSLMGLLSKAAILNYFINQETFEPSSILYDSMEKNPTVKRSHQVESSYQQKEDFVHNNSREIETIILNLVAEGNVDGIKSLSFPDSALRAGVFAPNQLRQMKNTFIISTALAARAAISSGVDADTAFQTSDLYIQTAEKMNTLEAVGALSFRMFLDYAQMVKDCIMPNTSDELLQRAIRYILHHTNCPITASDVAEYVGFSRSYFSTYFREQLGFTISAFILRCKLEEAKHLLAFTDKPLSVISSYLCFSSQSHFQTAFKKQYHVTPLQYRKEPEKYGRGLLKNER